MQLKNILLLFVFAIPAVTSAAPLGFTITPLNALGGVSSRALGINDLGQVVGEAANASGSLRAVTWDSLGAPTDLGTLGGLASQAYSINNLGEVTGRATRADGRFRAFFRSTAGTMVELPTAGGQAATGVDDGTGFGINESSVVGGHTRNAAGQLVGFTWNSVGGTTSIGTPGGASSRGWDINESGQISGWGGDHTSATVGYRWSPGTGFNYVGSLLAGDATFGIGINDDGDVVGSATQTGRSRAWFWNGTTIADLGTPATFTGAGANHVNNLDQAVGVSYRFDGSNNRIDNTATLWEGGVGYDLNAFLPPASGWYLQTAYKTNNESQIVGWGQLNGQTRGFLLTPVAVPEPATLAVGSLAALAVLWGRRHGL